MTIRPDIDEAVRRVSEASLVLEDTKAQLLALLTGTGVPPLEVIPYGVSARVKKISRVFNIWVNKEHVGIYYLPFNADGKESQRDGGTNITNVRLA